MSETRCAWCVPANTVDADSVKFQFPESMSFDPMSIYPHAASQTDREDSSVTTPVSVRRRRQIGLADMSETAARGTVVHLTLYGSRGGFTFPSLEFSLSIAFDGSGEPSR
jgi:hypothetical protein